MYLVIMDDPNFEEIKQVIHEHCEETGLSYDDFIDIFGPQIAVDTAVYKKSGKEIKIE
jgi:hypothetical protein